MKQIFLYKLQLLQYYFVFAGSVIPAQDYDFLYQAGVVAIFGPGTSVAKAACQIMEITNIKTKTQP